MQTTLAERIKEAMAGPPKVSGRELARACGVSPPSVSDWRSGKTKTIEGANLIAAAEKLKVRAKWLADGTGTMREQYPSTGVPARESDTVTYFPHPIPDPLESKLISLFHELDSDGKQELVRSAEFFVAGKRPHQDGQALSVASPP